jgi:peptidyl-prolyl cis-trans isomerase C
MQTRVWILASFLLATVLAAHAQPQPGAPSNAPALRGGATPRPAHPQLKAQPMTGTPKPEAAAAPLSPEDVKRREQKLATFKGGQLTVGELEDAISRQSPLMRGRYTDQHNLKDLYDKTLRFALLAAEAEKRGYDKNDAVAQAVKQNAVQALMKADFDNETSADAVTKEEIAKYYEEHIGEYVQPAMQRASHILVGSEAEAKALLAEAKKADLREFRQLARDKSIDEATKMRGGDLRYFDQSGKARDQPELVVPPQIVRAAFALKNVGDTSPQAIKLPGGYSIVKLTGQRPALSRKLDEVDETIRARLWRERRQNAIEGFVAKLRENAKPELHPELMNAIKLEDAAGPGPGMPPGVPGMPPGHTPGPLPGAPPGAMPAVPPAAPAAPAAPAH